MPLLAVGCPSGPQRFPAHDPKHLKLARASRCARALAFVCAGLLALMTFAPAAMAAKKDAGSALAPAFVLPGRGGDVSLAALKGKVVYVDFWASWCGPCRASFPWMAGLAERQRSKGLEIVAINLDKDRALADAFLQEHPASFKVAFDPAGKTAESYEVAAMPTSFLIGKDGRILLRHAGFDLRRTAELEKQIEEALAR